MPPDYQHKPRKAVFGGVDLHSSVDTVLYPRYRIYKNVKPTVGNAFRTRPGNAMITPGAYGKTDVHSLGFLYDPVRGVSATHASGWVRLGGTFTAGDELTITVNGFDTTYIITPEDAAGAGDTIVQGMADAINANADVNVLVTATSGQFSFGTIIGAVWRVILTAVDAGVGGNTITLAASIAGSASTQATGWVDLWGVSAQGSTPVGPNAPGTAATVGPGVQPWANPNNIKVEDGALATCTLFNSPPINPPNTPSEYLTATNFGFAIPGTATVLGVKVEIKKRQVSGTSAVYDSSVQLVAGGSTQNKGKLTAWSGSLSFYTYGGATDKWGSTTLTPALVNDPAFGARIAVQCTGDPGSGAVAGVDFIRITIYYSGVGNSDEVDLTVNAITKVYVAAVTSDMSLAAASLAALVNADLTTLVTALSSKVSDSPVTYRVALTAITPGAGGNAIAFSVTLIENAPPASMFSNVSGATLSGGGAASAGTETFGASGPHLSGGENAVSLSGGSLLFMVAVDDLVNVLTLALLDTGYSGFPVTIVYYRLSGSSYPYAIIGDFNQMRKFNSAGEVAQLGLAAALSQVISTVITAVTLVGGPDTSFGVEYDWRGTYFSTVTKSESNPTPIQLETTVDVKHPVQLEMTPSIDSQIDAIRFYRRGGTLADAWRLVGQQGNWRNLAVGGAEWIAGIATIVAPGHGMLEGQGVGIRGIFPAGYNGDVIITSVTDNTFSYELVADPGAYVGGGYIFLEDISSDEDIASVLVLQLDNDVPVTTTDLNGDTVKGVALPFIWGPYNGLYIFGCGDPYRPGFLYWSKPGNPDAWPVINNVEVTQPSDPLQNGFIWAGRPWVFSREKLYDLFVSPIGGGLFVPMDATAGAGLRARWGLAAGPDKIGFWWVAKDGIMESSGGLGLNITNDALFPLFHEETVEGNAPIDWTQERRIRLAWFDSELWFAFQDTGGTIQVWICDVLHGHRWRQSAYSWGPRCLFPEPETDNTFMFGGNDGKVYEQDEALSADAGVAIACKVREGFDDSDDPQQTKEYGGVVIDLDPQGASIQVTAYFADGTAQAVALAPITGVGRKQVEQGLKDGAGEESYGRSMALDFAWTSTARPVVFGQEPLVRPDEVPATHFESPPSSHGLPGFAYCYDGYIGLRSTADVTLTLVLDGVSQTVIIASTGGARRKVLVQFARNKGKTVQFKLDSAVAFRVYREDSYVNIYPWQGGSPAQLRPFQV